MPLIKVTVNPTTLIIGIIAGCFGLAYFVFGKRQAKVIPLLSGMGLCVIPYFIENVAILILVCLALIIAPFVIKV
jgi:hypothetical protein